MNYKSLTSHLKRRFSQNQNGYSKMDMMRNQQKGESKSGREGFPVVTAALGVSSVAVYYYWNVWDYRRAHRSFIFSEMNFLNQGNY